MKRIETNETKTAVSALYFRTYLKSHIIGFKRVITSRKDKGTIEYLALTAHAWTREKFLYDAEIQLSVPPVGVSTLQRL